MNYDPKVGGVAAGGINRRFENIKNSCYDLKYCCKSIKYRCTCFLNLYNQQKINDLRLRRKNHEKSLIFHLIFWERALK